MTPTDATGEEIEDHTDLMKRAVLDAESLTLEDIRRLGRMALSREAGLNALGELEPNRSVIVLAPCIEGSDMRIVITTAPNTVDDNIRRAGEFMAAYQEVLPRLAELTRGEE